MTALSQLDFQKDFVKIVKTQNVHEAKLLATRAIVAKMLGNDNLQDLVQICIQEEQFRDRLTRGDYRSMHPSLKKIIKEHFCPDVLWESSRIPRLSLFQ